MYSRSRTGYKRLTRTVDLTGVTGRSRRTCPSGRRYNTEPDWDFVFVEAHTVGQDDWTTLPDQNGHTSYNTGASCPAGWGGAPPDLEHYQTLVENGPGAEDNECLPDGHARRVERGERQLGRLAELVDRPERLQGQAGRAVDRVRDRLGHDAGAGRDGRRHDRTAGRVSQTSFETRATWAAGRSRARTRAARRRT